NFYTFLAIGSHRVNCSVPCCIQKTYGIVCCDKLFNLPDLYAFTLRQQHLVQAAIFTFINKTVISYPPIVHLICNYIVRNDRSVGLFWVCNIECTVFQQNKKALSVFCKKGEINILINNDALPIIQR